MRVAITDYRNKGILTVVRFDRNTDEYDGEEIISIIKDLINIDLDEDHYSWSVIEKETHIDLGGLNG